MRGKSSAAPATNGGPAKKKKRASSRTANVLGLLGAFVATSVALGLLLAGVMLPLTGLTGSGVRSGVKMFNDIPGSFTANALSQQSKILAKDGSVIATPYDENRIVVPSKAIPQLMKNAQVAIEDERFYQHGALDQRGIARAIAANLFSSSTQGASTLTQQYVKVADQRAKLESGNREAALEAVAQRGSKAYIRKLKQLKMAVDLEKTHTKDQILTSYLNLVYFGDQQYGVEAASRHYFGHPAKDLTIAEAATLAGVVNLPDATNPVKNPKAAVKRRNIVIAKMIKQGYVSEAAGRQAIDSPLTLRKEGNSSGGCATSKYPYYCDYVTNWIAQQPALGKTAKERLGKLKTGGLIIQTALDTKKVSALEKNLKKRVPEGNSADVQAAGVVVEPGTGYVTALAQNSKYDITGANNFSTSVNWARSGFPIGSTAKIFAIVEAMRQGRAVDSTVDVPRMNSTNKYGNPVYQFTSRNFPGPCGQGGGVWPVANDHPVPPGPMKLEKATAESVNTAFGALTAQLGPCKVHADFKRLGVMSTRSPDGSPLEVRKDPSSIVLGADSSTPMMMANAFATVAADGKYCAPRPVVSIKQANGKPLDIGGPECKQVLTPQQARGTARIFAHVFDSDGTAVSAKLAGGREAFGKTGTVDDSKHTWFVGATKQLSTAVWVGRAFTGQGGIKNITIGGKHINTFLYGGDIAAPVWQAAMNEMSKGMPKQKFADPSSATVKGDQIAIPDVKGKSEADARAALTKLKLQVAVQKQGSSEVASGQAFRTEPAAGQKIGEGKKVRLYVKP